MSPPSIVEKPRSGQGRGGVHPPQYGGDGDRGPGDGPDYERRLHRARLGLILAIVSITMLFTTVTAIFLLRHHFFVVDPPFDARPWVSIVLPVRLLLWNTLILLVSSFTMEMARRGLAREMVLAPVRAIAGIAGEREIRFPWLGITALLGIAFLGGQWLAWEAFQAQGFHASTGGSSAFFYILTGAHALHLAVGVLILLYASAISLLRRPIEHRRIVVELTAWYWHFMALLWVYVFALLQFGR
jgi:cytochrome c oxidase subunit 3